MAFRRLIKYHNNSNLLDHKEPYKYNCKTLPSGNSFLVKNGTDLETSLTFKISVRVSLIRLTRRDVKLNPKQKFYGCSFMQVPSFFHSFKSQIAQVYPAGVLTSERKTVNGLQSPDSGLLGLPRILTEYSKIGRSWIGKIYF